jgi:predicted kinase
MKPYIDLANQYGYTIFTIIVENRHGNSSVHDVPEETMKKMKDRFEIKL